MRYRLLSEYGAVLREMSLGKLMLYLGDMDGLCPMFRGCFFGMNPFDDTADTQYIRRCHGFYVKCQALILRKLLKLTPSPYQRNRWRKKRYKVELQRFSNNGILQRFRKSLPVAAAHQKTNRNRNIPNGHVSTKQHGRVEYECSELLRDLDKFYSLEWCLTQA